ncbi:MAG TPA: RluA family pseudouridine synthase [Thermotogota bacterium]|nr:RluA family pseudouridine synthase [Thermotogota bacterium]HPJ87572.1 RluA family pseudouridine synthase [Thermotogota bacterium]HPR94777.1 RluA family pseudouridine synthase [Thermotogota bacterium]
MEIKVNELCVGERLDSFVVKNTPEWVSRNLIQTAIKERKIFVNSVSKKQSYKVKFGETVVLEVPSKPEITVEPENIPLNIIYEDEDIIVINKPANMIVHPVPNNTSGTLVNALLYHFKQFQDWEDLERPGIVHRLDKDTSGAIIVAKNQKALKNLSEQFHDRKNKKEYITIVEGIIEKDRGQIEKPLARNQKNRIKMAVDYSGKYALSYYTVLKRFSDTATLVMVQIKTGRTHQIRVHMKSIGHPVLGDEIYAFRDSTPEKYDCKRQMLHALKLGIFHPSSGEWMEFIAPLHEDFKAVIRSLNA